MSTKNTAVPTADRIASLDQFRGYAIFGMLLVNFFGHYKTAWVEELNDGFLKSTLDFIFHQQLHHHNEFMTYADTIAPIFMFVVGIGMRLSWTRRVQHVDPSTARKAMGKRYFTLVLIAFAIYTGWLWDALMNIGLAGLVALLIVDKKWSVRIAYALGLVVAYQLIFSFTSYGELMLRLGKYGRELDWPAITMFLPLRGDLLNVPINGALIGHWSWAFMLIFGTIAYDIMATQDRKKILTGLIGFGVVLTIAGWGARYIGTQAYYDKAEPYAASLMLDEPYGPLKRHIEANPEIFAAVASSKDSAAEALEKGDMAAFAKFLKDQSRELRAVEHLSEGKTTVIQRKMDKVPPLFAAIAKGNPLAEEALEAKDLKTFQQLRAERLNVVAEAVPYLQSGPEQVGKIVGKSPGIFSSFAKGNPEAEAALAKRDMGTFASIMKDELAVLATKAPETAPRLGNAWVFSKNYHTLPFPFWATALCLFHLLLFYVICDVMKINIPGMMVIGLNPLFIYIFQSLTLEMLSNVIDEFGVKNTTSGTLVLGSFVLYFGLVYAMAHYMYKRNIIVKL